MVKQNKYVLTHHAFDEMIADNLHTYDIESIITKGSIVRMETDQQSQERKYVILGTSHDGFLAELVAKISGRVVIITVYLL